LSTFNKDYTQYLVWEPEEGLRGMNKSPLEVNPDSKYDDKMTKIFSKVFELIDIVRSHGMDELLHEYL
jgi:hypothetical protein